MCAHVPSPCHVAKLPCRDADAHHGDVSDAFSSCVTQIDCMFRWDQIGTNKQRHKQSGASTLTLKASKRVRVYRKRALQASRRCAVDAQHFQFSGCFSNTPLSLMPLLLLPALGRPTIHISINCKKQEITARLQCNQYEIPTTFCPPSTMCCYNQSCHWIDLKY